jgi:glucose-1-phosphate cytidylyltransferase
MSDVTIDMRSNKQKIHTTASEPWKITLVDTGLNTMTGGRIKQIQKYVGNSTFMMTYGDGLCDVNLKKLLIHHKETKKIATITAIQPTARYGALNMNDSHEVLSFAEKPKGDNVWVNGGFFVLEPKIFSYIKDDMTIWEREPMEHLARSRQLSAYKHDGFWKCMDTLRDKIELENEWKSGRAPWKYWEK